ncbi:MAG: hypothetical protein ACE15C_21450 [Phycisphaerae bacterium]
MNRRYQISDFRLQIEGHPIRRSGDPQSAICNLQSRSSAFTLLEVVLAVTLGIGAVAGVLAFYQHVMWVRATVFKDVQVVSSQRLVMEKLTDELRGSMVYPFLGMGLSGQSGQVQFVTAAVPGPSAWAVRQNTDDPIPPEQDLQIVTYSLQIPVDDRGSPLTDEQGNIIINGLQRACQKVVNSTNVEGQQGETVLLAPSIKCLYLRYWDGAAWAASWGGRDLPLAVEVTLGTAPMPDGMTLEQYQEQYSFFRRVIYVPGGMKALGATTIIRGLDGTTGGP